ncbi:MAG: BON domain-containing protein [Terracidiphilus sp.]|nr:BON domain-containing protein [Terracidiphilus sp.]
MRRGSRLLVLAMAGLSAAAAAQQIVIEPTNGRPASATQHVTRPAAVQAAPKQEAKPAKAQSAAPKSAAKRHTEKQTVAKTKAAPAAEVAKDEPRETAPQVPTPAKKYPARPAWALNDMRDAHSLETEITNAISHDAKLNGSAIQVKVDDEAVTLLGRAAGSDERLQAERLAQSYAWNRKVVDKIEVAPRVSAQR